MPKRDPDLLVSDILEAIRKIEQYLAGIDRVSFLRDEKTVDAVVRNLEVIGEASRKLPDDFTSRHREVPWRQIAGLGNRLLNPHECKVGYSSMWISSGKPHFRRFPGFGLRD